MKNSIPCLFLFMLFNMCSATLTAQQKTYATSGGEMLFSFAKINDKGKSANSTLRWAPLFNPQFLINTDFSKKYGIFYGLSIKNVGYIYENYTTDTTKHATYKKKFRSYNLGIPVGIKFGNMDKVFGFAGYELEFPFLYKEKTFNSGERISRTTAWFSRREKLIQHGFFIGIQTKKGLSIKFRYYLSQFHNQNYINSDGIKVYDQLKSNVFYFSIGTYFSLWKDDTEKKSPVTKTSATVF